MNDRVQRRQRAESTEDQPLTKAEKRAIAKERKAKALAARRRRQAVLGALAGLAVVGVIAAAFVLFSRSDNPEETPGSAAGSETPAVPETTTGAPQAFPPTPPGADPVLAERPKATPGGGTLTKLTVTPIIEGQGAAVAAGQTVTVNYVGAKYGTAEEFDASWNRSQPFSFQIGANQVIPGWDQGLIGVKVGSRVQLDIPANLAYGDNPSGGAPGGPLRFIVDVLNAQ